MLNKIVGYRKMLGYTQSDMAEILGISVQAYCQKEKRRINFADKEKVVIKNILTPHFPCITIDEIFF